MLEKIPVGGWRHAESRVVEVFVGKAKARDVVPNWPKSRSTSNSGSSNVARRAALYWHNGLIHVFVYRSGFGDDPSFWDDLHEEQAEERRKAEMMEGWHLQNRRIIYDGFSGLAEWVRLMYVEPDDVGLLIVGEVKP